MSNREIGRREFGRRVAAVVAAAPVYTAACVVEAANPSDDADADKKRDGIEKPPDEVDLVIQTIVARYPHERLDKKTLDAIRGDVQYHLLLSRAIATFPLKNSDAPTFHFSAWRAPVPGSK